MKMTPNLLAFYLGCEIIDREGQRGTLTEVGSNGYFTYEIGGDDIISAIGAGDTLILRHLSSMTEEEQYEAGIFYPEGDRWSVTQFTYLLSKGFDIFGLLESGDAVDKDSLV
jgi:hypothetical protein